MRQRIVTIGVALCLCAQGLAAADLSITEFMASNSTGLRDENNEYSDWVEIHNSSTEAINLLNWSLTDAQGNPTKWRFPSTNIAPGAYMIVFASGKDRRVPGAPLHTSFNLSAGGEYLALIRPNGTIASAFAPEYPQQVPNVSYGLGVFTTNAVLISSNTMVRVHVPANGNDGTNWAYVGFNDSAWTSGLNGVGFGSANAAQADYASAVLPSAPVGFWRLNETGGTTAANLGSGGQNGTYNSVTFGTAGPRPPQFNGFEPDNNAPTLTGASHVAGPPGLLSGRNAFTVGGWIKPSATPAARTGLFGQNDCVEFGFITGTTLECWTPGGGSVTGVPYPHPLNEWHHVLAVADGSSIRIFIDGVQVAAGGSTTANYGSSTFNFNIGGGGVQDATGNFFTGQIDEVVVYHRALSTNEIATLYQAGLNPTGGSTAVFVRTDIGGAMSNVNASAYIRIPFTIENPTNAALLTLRMRYDDGFVAYINGEEVVRANAPASTSFNSVATNMHSPLGMEEFRLGTLVLRPGNNVLAIHGLNAAANDADFLVAAELSVTITAADSTLPLYFTSATPGGPNEAGVAILGPAIVAPSHSPTVPKDHEDLFVTARVIETFHPVTQVMMRYRLMFGSEVEVQMLDDGLHGDGAAGDGVYGATIPSSVGTNGQMIRWFFRASDTAGNVSRWPLFTAPNSAEYLGTIVDPTNVVSKLPIVHLFAPPTILNPGPNAGGTQPGADSQNGGRVSLFYDGELYDNIHMELRGNSTAGYAKKSHRLNFNPGHLFRHWGPGPRIRKTSFVADYPDPTYMRQGLSYLLADLMGAPAPFYEPTRLQLNGQFYQLANHNDVHGEELLSRLGFDPNGALYNAAGQVTPGRASTGGFEKKTRNWDNDNDYTAMANAIAESLSVAARRTNLFEIFDLPQAINYLVAARWVHENDDVWANMSLYRDSDGDGLWRIIPFDLNLSWGAIFAEGDVSLYTGVQATNDNHKAHPLYGSSQALALSGPGGAYNRVYDAVFQVPETRQMFLRRLRTLMDTYVKPPGTPTNTTFFEQRMIELRDLMAEEANRDRAWWGWPARGGQGNFDPGINITNGVAQMIHHFFHPRRAHFYGKHSITNTALPIGISKSQNAGIPLEQPADAVVRISQIEFNPGSGNQAHEFIQITNPNNYAVDISGWELGGGVNFTFRPGTVIPMNGVLYLTPDLLGWRTRTVTPRGGQGHFVVGDYRGTLDARGESLTVRRANGTVADSTTYVGTPSLAQQYLRITELMYNPGPTNAGSLYPQQDFEYIELKNIGPVQLNLVGVRFTNGIEFTFTATNAVTNLAPGQAIVLVKNQAAFLSRYGGGATVAGIFGGNLDNGGERIRLHDAVGEEILDFTYNNSWYRITDGFGFSLVIRDETAPFDTWGRKESWRASGVINGTPGGNDPGPVDVAPVLVNEVLSASDLALVDFVELRNPTDAAANIGGWYISDDFYTPKKFRIPDNTSVPSGGFVSFNESHFNPTPGVAPSFSFSSSGDEVFLFAADASGNLLGYVHGFDFGPAAANVSFGRYVNSVGEEHFVAQSQRTPGAANSGPLVGPVVVSEIMYRPPDHDFSDNSDAEFIELHNISDTPVWLHDTSAPTNRWRLRDAVSFSFATNTMIAPGGFLLVVGFDPATNASVLAGFRATYGLSDQVQIVGPYGGKLDNSAENVELVRPEPANDGGVDSVLIDKVDYKDKTPWPSAADGFGPSLQRLVVSAYGNDPTNWIASAPSPGALPAAAGAPMITGQPQAATVVAYLGTNFTVMATGQGLRYQWRFDDANIPGATNATLALDNVQPTQAGSYSVAVYNSGGAVISSGANLTVLIPVTILAQPVGGSHQPNSTTTLSVNAIGTGTIRYQWSMDGNILPQATNSSLTLSNLSLAHHGIYQVALSDDISSAASDPVEIYVLVRPGIVVPPEPMTVLAGQPFTLSVTATGAPPLSYRWLRAGLTYVYPGEPTLTVTGLLANATFRVAITNLAGSVASGNVTITVLADDDRDGMADAWEVRYGFNTNDVSDGVLDSDGDGMINRDEYVADTNPHDPTSLLKLDLLRTSGVVLRFIAQSNNTYTVQYSTNLQSGWQNLERVPRQGVVREIEVNAGALTNGASFYRVATPAVP